MPLLLGSQTCRQVKIGFEMVIGIQHDTVSFSSLTASALCQYPVCQQQSLETTQFLTAHREPVAFLWIEPGGVLVDPTKHEHMSHPLVT